MNENKIINSETNITVIGVVFNVGLDSESDCSRILCPFLLLLVFPFDQMLRSGFSFPMVGEG